MRYLEYTEKVLEEIGNMPEGEEKNKEIKEYEQTKARFDSMVGIFDNIIGRELNYMGFEKEIKDALVYSLQHQHRTLQANFWRMIKEVAVEYAEFRYDDRNEQAVEFAKEITKINVHIPFI